MLGWGNFGWRSVAHLVSSWLPTDLGGSTLLQWLSIPLVSPSEVTDSSTNAVDALLVDSVCATFDGSSDEALADAVAVGSADFFFEWSGRVYFNSAGDYIWGSGLAEGVNISMASGADTTSFRYYLDDGGGLITTLLTVAYTLGDELILRFSRVGSTVTIYCKNVETDIEYSDTFTNSDDFAPSEGLALGAVRFGGGVSLNSNQSCNYFKLGVNASTLERSYPCVAGAGLFIHDIVNGKHMAITVGSGGQATFWGSRQDVFHDSALRGCTMAWQIPDSNTAVFPAEADGTGLALSMRVKIPSASDCTLFESNGKALEARINGGNTDLYYDDTFHSSSITVDAWSTVTVSGGVDLTTQARIGQSSGLYQDAFEIAWWTIENNGSWSAGSYDAVTGKAYNMEFPATSATAPASLALIQYPALADLTDDVDGAGLVNVGGGVGVHNGGVYKQKQVGEILPNFNSASSIVVCPVGSWDSQDPYVKAKYTPTSGGGSSRLVASRTGSSIGFELYLSGNKLAFWSTDFSSVTSLSALTVGTMYDIEAAYDRVGARIFVRYRVSGTDGAWTEAETAIGAPFTVASGKKCNIGGQSDVPTAEGLLAEVTISDYQTSALVGKYNLWDITGTTSPDTSGNGNDGVNTDLTLDTASDVSGGTILAGNGLFDLNGLYLPKAYTDHLVHISYTNNVWDKWTKVGQMCILTDVVTTDTLTEAEHTSMSTWKGGSSCVNGILPFNALLDVNGIAILDVNGDYILTAL